jgi:hypothetical protein
MVGTPAQPLTYLELGQLAQLLSGIEDHLGSLQITTDDRG